jgi:hypothetical protein
MTQDPIVITGFARTPMDACRAVLARTDKSQRCVVSLSPPDASGPKPRSESLDHSLGPPSGR